MKFHANVLAGAVLGLGVLSASLAEPPPQDAPELTREVSTLKLPSATVTGLSKIKHIIIIMQENRSFDHYFGTYPGADGIPMGRFGNPKVCLPDSRTGKCVTPFHNRLDVHAGGPHTYQFFLGDLNHGQMNGFINVANQGFAKPTCNNPADPGCYQYGDNIATMVMGWHDAREIPNYWAYAKHFVLQDHMFEPTASWSLPSHLYLVSGWSAFCADQMTLSNCVDSISSGDLLGPIFPNPNLSRYLWTDITYLLNKQGVSWKYYLSEGLQPDCDNDEEFCSPKTQSLDVPSIWNPLPAFKTVVEDHQLRNVQSVYQYLQDAEHGNLPAVSWIAPSDEISEHPPSSIHAGESYVTKLVNTAMRGPDWDSTVIFISWDDWGGFYDHVPPPQIDGSGYGFRVPGLMISPYAKAGYIDHQTLSFDAYLKFIEDVFLGGQRLDPATDGRPDPRPLVRESVPTLGDLSREFDFTQPPRPPLILSLDPKPGRPSVICPYGEGKDGRCRPRGTIVPPPPHP